MDLKEFDLTGIPQDEFDVLFSEAKGRYLDGELKDVLMELGKVVEEKEGFATMQE